MQIFPLATNTSKAYIFYILNILFSFKNNPLFLNHLTQSLRGLPACLMVQLTGFQSSITCAF